MSWAVSLTSKAVKTDHSLLNIQANKVKTIKIVSEIARKDRQAVVRSVKIKKFSKNVRNHAKLAKIQI